MIPLAPPDPYFIEAIKKLAQRQAPTGQPQPLPNQPVAQQPVAQQPGPMLTYQPPAQQLPFAQQDVVSRVKQLDDQIAELRKAGAASKAEAEAKIRQLEEEKKGIVGQLKEMYSQPSPKRPKKDDSLNMKPTLAMLIGGLIANMMGDKNYSFLQGGVQSAQQTREDQYQQQLAEWQDQIAEMQRKEQQVAQLLGITTDDLRNAYQAQQGADQQLTQALGMDVQQAQTMQSMNMQESERQSQNQRLQDEKFKIAYQALMDAVANGDPEAARVAAEQAMVLGESVGYKFAPGAVETFVRMAEDNARKKIGASFLQGSIGLMGSPNLPQRQAAIEMMRTFGPYASNLSGFGQQIAGLANKLETTLGTPSISELAKLKSAEAAMLNAERRAAQSVASARRASATGGKAGDPMRDLKNAYTAARSFMSACDSAAGKMFMPTEEYLREFAPDKLATYERAKQIVAAGIDRFSAKAGIGQVRTPPKDRPVKVGEFTIKPVK
jgi:hypothetical protein